MVAKIEKVTESGTHTGDVTVLLPDKSFIYSGGADGLIKVRIKKNKKKNDFIEKSEFQCY